MESKDIIITLALQLDLPTLLNYCRTSKRINDLVCNNNLFWLAKLKKDFKISFEDKNEAKSYYKDLTKEIRYYPDVNELYSHGISTGRVDLVKIALERGANINHMDNNRIPLINSIIFNHPDIADFLLEYGIIRTEKDFTYNMSEIIILMNTNTITREQRRELSWLIYDKIFPRMYSKLSKYKSFWRTSILSLEKYKRDLPILYEKRINELKALL